MKSSGKRGLLLGLGYLLLLTALLYGFYAYEMGRLGKALKEREALRAEIETHGPWVEQAVWVSADGGAYVLPPWMSRMRSPRRTSSSAANGTTLR